VLKQLLAVFFSIPAPWVVGAVFLLPAAETALFAGFVIPGETTVILGGVLAAHSRVPLAAVLAAAILGPIMGDSIGYLVGRRYGGGLFQRRFRRRWGKAQRWVTAKGPPAVFLGRFTPFVRTVTPTAAGAAGLRYGKFLPWSAAAGLVWGAGSALLGYFGAAHYRAVLHWAGRVGLVLLVLAGGLAIFWGRRAVARYAKRKVAQVKK
jgi:membrane protein DedA with SNARE-associated domain